MVKHIPYFCSTAAIIGAVIFAIKGETQIAGFFLVASGLLYLTFSDKILLTTNEIEERFPPLKVLSKLVGGNTPRGMKIGGIALLLVGVVWIFLYKNV
jgi:hypothetical protein